MGVSYDDYGSRRQLIVTCYNMEGNMTFIQSAQLFGVVSLILALGILFNLDNARQMAMRVTDSVSGYILGGVLPLVFGTWVVTQHSHWLLAWPTVVTVIGWAMLLAGLMRVWFVKTWRNIMKAYNDKLPVLFSLFGLIFGLLLSYVGFFSHRL